MGGRGVIRLKYVHAFRDRFGRMRYYFRRHGKRTALPGLPGSGEFMAAYAGQLSETSKRVEQRPKPARGTFSALAIRYFGSPQYQTLSATSRSNYRRVVDAFLKQHGHRQVDQMTREYVDIIIGKMVNKPGAGIILFKRLRTLVRYAMALGWTDRDPTTGVKSYRSKEIHTWNEEEIAIFEKRWPEESRERLAFALLLYTGQRGSDVHRMMWTDLVGDAIRVVQQKTAAKLSIPIHASLSTCSGSQTVTTQPFLRRLTANLSRSRASATWCQRRSATPDYLAAVNHTASGRPQRVGSQRQVVRRARSWRSPDTRPWPKLNATPARRNRSD
jgi:enterobacteria phage integrase